MGQAYTQPEVAIKGAVSELEGANSVSEWEPGKDLVSGLAKVLPWLAKLGNAPRIDLASEGSALAMLKGLAMGISTNLQGATTGTQEPPRATATTSHKPKSSIALPAVVGATTSTSPLEKQGPLSSPLGTWFPPVFGLLVIPLGIGRGRSSTCIAVGVRTQVSGFFG
ncbi:hypothetical protein NDU88_001216 [Pleurodeles waltl]|uniref:Uncharacterized protein n=1 Tax=Pleurodeles waltl TaxID=8319 RepID=A0AAV7VVS3_PLEWA|nr:hypothetical protein NDU88_001216 [Pleurodeles waltl]